MIGLVFAAMGAAVLLLANLALPGGRGSAGHVKNTTPDYSRGQTDKQFKQ